MSKTSKTELQNWINDSTSFRLIFITLLVFFLLIPVGMIVGVIFERDGYQADVSAEISDKWGRAQTVAGPILSVPYTIQTDQAGNLISSGKYVHFLPESLEVDGQLDSEIRARGLFEAVVYSSQVKFSGYFKDLGAYQAKYGPGLDWSQAIVSVGISHLKGLNEEVSLNLPGRNLLFKASLLNEDVLKQVGVEDYDSNFKYGSGISLPVALKSTDLQDKLNFSFSLNLNGSDQWQFVPVGNLTQAKIKSDWPHPSFKGAFLANQRDLTDQGFSAQWEILGLSRNFPQTWVGATHNIYQAATGVKLLAGVDGYDKVNRSTKYAFLIIALIFLVFFVTEILIKQKLHLIQYVLVGFAIVLFYLLLLSISELTNFTFAYLCASVSTIGLISWYAKGILRNSKIALIQAFILSFIYGVVYFLLQSNDYALLWGSLFLFVVLGVIMHLTRKVDWY